MFKKLFVFILALVVMAIAAGSVFAANEGLYYLGATVSSSTLNTSPGTLKSITLTSNSSTSATCTIKDGTTTKAIIDVVSTAPVIQTIDWRFFSYINVEYSSATIHGTFKYDN
jgi:hypothetical protein